MDSFYALQFLAVVLIGLYYYLIWPFDYWKKQGVKSAPGAIPGLGHVLSVLTLRENISTVCNRLYEKHCSESSMVGAFFMRTPMLIIREPELAKSVLVKEFQCFQNNAIRLNARNDPFMAKNPFFAVDDAWKESRKQLVNNMSQKKLKSLYRIMHQVCLKFESHLGAITKNVKEPELEVKQLCLRFTTELVANTAFGIEGHSFEASPDPRSFAAVVEKLLQPTFASGLRQTVSLYLTNLATFFKVSFMPKGMTDFLRNTVKSILQHRKQSGVVADDFLQMTIEGIDEPDENTVAGHISSYFFDAYETSATIAAFASYQLSRHSNVQEKARQEIKNILSKHEGNLSYESLNEMVYLKQVILETVRLHPVLGVTLRVCTQKVTLQDSDGHKCCLEPGDLLCIPVQSIHTDGEFWKAPRTFDPDRFSEERKNDVVKFAFLPFSEGPRTCAGMRYGIMTVKAILIKILSNYRLEFSGKTKTPLQYDQMNFLTAADGGLWVKLHKIAQEDI